MPKDLRNIWISYEEIYRLIEDPGLRHIGIRALEQKDTFTDEDIIKFANIPYLRHIAIREIEQKEAINIYRINDIETYLSLVDESEKGEFNVIFHVIIGEELIEEEFLTEETLLKLLTHPKLKTTVSMAYDTTENYFYRRLFRKLFDEKKTYNIRDMTIDYNGPTETFGIIGYVLEANMPYLEEVSFINAGEDDFPTTLKELLTKKRLRKLHIQDSVAITNNNIINLYKKGLLEGVQSISFYDCENITTINGFPENLRKKIHIIEDQ
jgi:hypothetical protein